MGSWNDMEDCPMCGSDESLSVCGDSRSSEVSVECVECGYYNAPQHMSLKEVNEIRENHDLKPLKKLKGWVN